MSTDPSPLPDVSDALPTEAEYGAIYTELARTERGRRFLREYASRNRHADTRMLVGAIARVEAALRGDPPQIPVALASDLVDLAMMVERAEALAAASAGAAAPETFAAFERIQDIAFALRERNVEADLCDALEAAIRATGAAIARMEAAMNGARSAGALLSDLAGRVKAMIAAAAAVPGATPALVAAAAAAPVQDATADAAADGSAEAAPNGVAGHNGAGTSADASMPEAPAREALPTVALSQAEADEDERFAQAVGLLAASFPVLAEIDEGARESFGEARMDDEGGGQTTVGKNPGAQSGNAQVGAITALPLGPGEGGRNEPAAPAPVGAAGGEPPGQVRPVVLPTAAFAAPPLPESTAPSPHQPAGAAGQTAAAPRPAGDPLATLRALSEEELIALFT